MKSRGKEGQRYHKKKEPNFTFQGHEQESPTQQGERKQRWMDTHGHGRAGDQELEASLSISLSWMNECFSCSSLYLSLSTLLLPPPSVLLCVRQ